MEHYEEGAMHQSMHQGMLPEGTGPTDDFNSPIKANFGLPLFRTV